MTSLNTCYRKTQRQKTRQQSGFGTVELFYINYVNTSFGPLALNKSAGLPVYMYYYAVRFVKKPSNAMFNLLACYFEVFNIFTI